MNSFANKMNIARKALIVFMASVLMMLSFAPAALAAKQSYVIINNDDTGIEKSEKSKLESAAQELAANYGVGVYLAYVDYSDKDTDRESAKALWNKRKMGLGDNDSGILLFIAVKDRRMVTITHGEGVSAFSDPRIDEMEDEEALYLSDDDWLGAGEEYYALAKETLAFYDEHGYAMAASDGRDTDFNNDAEGLDLSDRLLTALVAGLIVGIIAAVITRKVLKGQLKSVYTGEDADFYTKGEFALTSSTEVFMGTTVKRVPKPKVESSGGGGGGSMGGGGFGGSGGRGF